MRRCGLVLNAEISICPTILPIPNVITLLPASPWYFHYIFDNFMHSAATLLHSEAARDFWKPYWSRNYPARLLKSQEHS
jgi:hypothetical protein